jgi:putative peptidoglycan binding protein
MKRTLTAAVALTAALGMAGLVHAQSNAGPSTSPSTLSPSTPSTTNNPPMTSQGATQNPAPMSTPGSVGRYGQQNPQANAQSMNPGVQQVSESQIQQAQQQLKSAGLYRGQVDGVMGPETQTALSRFQHQKGLPETAQLDQQTMNQLMSNSGGSQNPGMSQTTTPQSPTSTQNPTMQNSPSMNGR